MPAGRDFILLQFFLTCLVFEGGVGFGAAGQDAKSGRPNIVLILADDMGFSDLGSYGGEIRTPHIDSLARDGLRFSQFYNCALCGPSRSALMTGLHPHQTGITNWTGLLNQRCVTLFELLKRAGYATYAVGRLDMVTAESWHDPANIAHWVDRFFGSTGHTGPGNYFKDVRNTKFYEDGQPFQLPAEGSYKTDLIFDRAVEYVEEAARKPAPFFLYVASYAPHWPLHAKPEDIARYRAMYRELGWDELRKRRHQRLVEKGILEASCALSPRDNRVPPWENAKFQDWEAERMATYAAQVDSLDHGVGRVLDALQRTKAIEHTLVIFLSDNGASDQAWTAPLDKPGQTWRVDGTPTRVGNTPDIQPGPADNFVTGGPPWANLSNTPFRQNKSTNHEGGIATPLIVRWPGVVKHPGTVNPELSHITDITATCLDAANVDYPSRFEGRNVLPISGKSLRPVLQGYTREGHASICWSTSGARAVREGRWKLVSLKDSPWELYDIASDRTELRDLAGAQPERVAEMTRVFEEWRRRGAGN